MIQVKNLTKSFVLKSERRYVARNISITLPKKTSIGLLGRNGAGKSTFLKMLAGTVKPERGSIKCKGNISWQIGYAGSFHAELSGLQNTRFVARVYGVDTDRLVEYVRDFSELGNSFEMPFRTYSSGMKARLAFGISMGIPFSYYLIDEVTSVGDAAFKKKCTRVLNARLETSGAIVVSHSDSTLRKLCTSGAVLENGKLTWFDDIEEAIQVHNSRM